MVYILRDKFETRNANRLDLRGIHAPTRAERSVFHGNYQCARNLKQAVQVRLLCNCLELVLIHFQYCMKGGDYITNMDLTKYQPSKKENAYKLARALAKEGDLKAAIKTLEASPQGARDLTLHPGMKVTLQSLCPKAIEVLHALDAFPNALEWDPKLTLILFGVTGAGKTTWAKAKATSLGLNPILISHVDKLRAFTAGEHKCVIFDDMNFSHWPRESQIHLVDTAEERDIHMRYTICTLPAGVARIITTNLSPNDILLTQLEEIKRRTTAVRMRGDKSFVVEW